jgi:hypothetical protein
VRAVALFVYCPKRTGTWHFAVLCDLVDGKTVQNNFVDDFFGQKP